MPAMPRSWIRMPFYPERCRKVDPRLEISSRATCRFQLGVDQPVELRVNQSFQLGINQSFQLGVNESVELGVDQSVELSVDM